MSSTISPVPPLVELPIDPVRDARQAYETLLKCREGELTLHVARSNLCLVVEGALLAFVAPALVGLKAGTAFADKLVPLLIVIFGIVLSAVSVTIVKGASFWISYWEFRLGELEEGALPTVKIFRDHPSEQNRQLLRRLPPQLRYVSSRGAMLQLFRVMFAVWCFLLLLVVTR